jgi:hypothetical protein
MRQSIGLHPSDFSSQDVASLVVLAKMQTTMEELCNEVERLRAALVEQRALLLYTSKGGTDHSWVHVRDAVRARWHKIARAQLAILGLLPE